MPNENNIFESYESKLEKEKIILEDFLKRLQKMVGLNFSDDTENGRLLGFLNLTIEDDKQKIIVGIKKAIDFIEERGVKVEIPEKIKNLFKAEERF